MSNAIVSLQFGHYSNSVGAHWWNIQESGFQYDQNCPSDINHDVLFREGLTLNGEVTFTPRLLLVDLKGSLKALPESGGLYEVRQNVTDTNLVQVEAEKAEEKISFQKDLERLGASEDGKIYDLDSEVRVWSDFLYTRFHPRTVNIIKEYQHSSEHTPFEIYPLGVSLWKTPQFCEDFTDKIRNYIEECDSFQGFHVVSDCIDGFSGLSTSCLEYLNDEYPNKSRLCFPVNSNTKTPLNVLNVALCFDALLENSSLFVPLTAPTSRLDFLTSYNPELAYHSSAILASALDTFTLSYRLKNSQHSLVDLCADLSVYGRKGAAASVCLPFPLKKSEDFIDCLNNWKGPLTHRLTPNCDIGTDYSLQAMTLRGVPENRLKRPPHVFSEQRHMPAYQCETVKEMLDFFMACSGHGSRTEVTVCREKMKVRTPFPRFFDNRVGRDGDVGDLGDEAVDSVKVLAGIHNGKYVGNVFNVLATDLEKVKCKKFHQFSSEGVENDHFQECLHRILDLRDTYEDDNFI